MRIAVLSDIHGNLPALEAVLEDLRPFDALWQLGDIVGYGPQPDEVVARLAAEGAVGVRGNHDAAAVGLIGTAEFNDDAATALGWTSSVIGRATRDYLTGLPERREEQGFTLAHGSPRDPTWEYIYSAAVARANLAAFSTSQCLVGHTHIPLSYHMDGRRVDTIVPPAEAALDQRRAIINPGSVGQPRDGDPRASALLIDTDATTMTWHRVPYDIEQVQQLMLARGLPARLAARLDFGL